MQEIRSFRRDDLDGMLALEMACEAVDKQGFVPTRERLAHQFAFPGFNVEELLFVLPDDDGSFAAVCGYIPLPGPDGFNVQSLISIRPDHRRDELGDSLFAFVLERTAEWQRKTSAAGVMSARVSDRQPFYRDLYSRAGFEPVRYFLELARDLSAPIPDAPDPSGIEIRSMRTEADIPSLHLAFNESFQDHFSPMDLTLEQTTHLVTSPGSRPDLTLLAFGEGGDPAGVCQNKIRTEYNMQNGASEAIVEVLGVRRPYRKAGLGRALLVRSLEMLKAEGMSTAILSVDADSLTGATRLYGSVGFCERKRTTIVQKGLGIRD